MTSSISILICLTLATSLRHGANAAGLENRIVGGSPTSIVFYPYQLALQYRGSQICGASIISNYWAMSAAHCVVSYPYPQYYTLRAGSTYRNTGGQVRQVVSLTVHPYYNRRTFTYDYSLLQVSSPFVYGPGVQRIALPSFGVPVNTMLTVTGWGTTSESSSFSPNNLMKVDVYVNNWNTCNGQYGNTLTATMFCASAPGKDSCQGDSGGPASAIINGIRYLTGIVSFGNGCARPNYPGIYSNVSFVRSWIRSVTGI